MHDDAWLFLDLLFVCLAQTVLCGMHVLLNARRVVVGTLEVCGFPVGSLPLSASLSLSLRLFTPLTRRHKSLRLCPPNPIHVCGEARLYRMKTESQRQGRAEL